MFAEALDLSGPGQSSLCVLCSLEGLQLWSIRATPNWKIGLLRQLRSEGFVTSCNRPLGDSRLKKGGAHTEILTFLPVI